MDDKSVISNQEETVLPPDDQIRLLTTLLSSTSDQNEDLLRKLHNADEREINLMNQITELK